MSYLIVRHKVKDFSVWKTIFDEHGATRASTGCKGGKLFTIAGDPNQVVVMMEWDNLENARKFVESEDLKSTMARAGVVDNPVIHFADLVEDFTQ